MQNLNQEKKIYHGYIRILVSVIVGFFLFFFGVYAGTHSSIVQKITKNLPFLEYSSAQAETQISATDSDMSRFWYVWNLLDQKYPFKEKVPTTQEKIYGAIAGLTASYNDPYTMFFQPEKAKIFSEEVKGEFNGIGVEIGIRNGLVVVIAPLKNSPAEKAGLQAGDVITDIDDKKINDTNMDKIISWIRGTEGSQVTLKVARKGSSEPLTFTVVRSKISIPVLDTEIKDEVFIIHFYSFSEKSAILFRDALEQFKQSGKKKLIIDMRNNPGGYLDAAIEIASDILPLGEVIVREDNGTSEDHYIYRSRGYETVDPQVTIGVLLNEGSASASEILAGALQDHKRAKIYGVKSFGKGSVQELITLSDSSSIKITIAKWFTPDNHSISEKGIIPDIVIDADKITKNKLKTDDPILDQVIIEMNKN